MLNKEKIEFLRWLNKQPSPISMRKMENLSAPNYTSARIEELRKDGYVNRNLEVENGDFVGMYCISDKGLAVLQEHDRSTHEKRVESIRYIITTSIAVVALITAIMSIVLQYL